MKLYIAGAFDSRADINTLSKILSGAGFDVISTWHKAGEDCRQLSEMSQFEIEEVAAKDCAQIRDCDILLCVTQEHSVTGGMYWEAGYAYGLGKEVFYWGNITNIFTADRNRYHYLDNNVSGWGALLNAMRTVGVTKVPETLCCSVCGYSIDDWFLPVWKLADGSYIHGRCHTSIDGGKLYSA